MSGFSCCRTHPFVCLPEGISSSVDRIFFSGRFHAGLRQEANAPSPLPLSVLHVSLLLALWGSDTQVLKRHRKDSLSPYPLPFSVEPLPYAFPSGWRRPGTLHFHPILRNSPLPIFLPTTNKSPTTPQEVRRGKVFRPCLASMSAWDPRLLYPPVNFSRGFSPFFVKSPLSCVSLLEASPL